MKCPNDDVTKMVATTRRDVLKVAGHIFEGTEAALRCPKCGEVVVPASEALRFESDVALKLARSGETSGEALKFIRKAAGVGAAELAELLDVVPETVSRWETGKKPIPRAAFVVLVSLLEDAQAGTTTTLDRLHTVAEPVKLKRTVHVGEAAAGRG